MNRAWRAPKFSPRTRLTLYLHVETEKAIKVSRTNDERDGEWLPKRAVRIEHENFRGNFGVIHVPATLARRKGLA